MAATEQFSLRWNNFHSNLSNSFHELFKAADMVDVTLAVDGQFLQAHKLVLSICSPYFKQLFKINPCKHPIVILKDVAHGNMRDILEFMYLGEVNVLRENLTSFLRTAELLQVKGLTGDDSSETSSRKDEKLDSDQIPEDEPDIQFSHILATDASTPCKSPTAEESLAIPTQKRPLKSSHNNVTSKKTKSNSSNKTQEDDHDILASLNQGVEETDYIEAPNLKIEGGTIEFEDIREHAMANVDVSANGSATDANSHDHGNIESICNRQMYKCDKCMKRFSRRDHLRTHEKNIHGEDVGPFICTVCSQLYKNSESLRKHFAKFHIHKVNELCNVDKNAIEKWNQNYSLY